MSLFRNSKSTVSEVDGTPVNFRSVPIGVLLKVRELVEANKSLAKLTAYFFVDKSKDNEVTTKKEVIDAEAGVYNEVTHIGEVKPEIAAMRQRDLEQGIAGLQTLLTSPESQRLLAEIVYHSAFEVWKAKGVSKEEAVLAICNEVDAEVFVELVVGAVRAHKGVLKGLGKLFLPKVDVEKELEERLAQV